jgi:hypothetical protein
MKCCRETELYQAPRVVAGNKEILSSHYLNKLFLSSCEIVAVVHRRIISAWCWVTGHAFFLLTKAGGGGREVPRVKSKVRKKVIHNERFCLLSSVGML